MLKRISLVAVICILCTGLSTAQEQPLLPSQPLSVIAMVLSDIQPSKVYRPKEKKPEPEKEKSVFTVDVSLLPERIVADTDGIKKQPFGRVVEPEGRDISFRYSLVPKLNFFSKNTYANIGVDSFVLHDQDGMREDFQVEGLVERSVWLILFGVKSFGFQERDSFILNGENYHLDFERWSYGGNIWGGLKLGSFNKSFIVVRFGKGLIETRGKEIYASSLLKDSVEVPLYLKRFEVDYQSVQARVAIPYFAPFAGVERGFYKRADKQEDRFGLKTRSFEELKTVGGVEFIPSTKSKALGFVVQRTNHLGSRYGLFFKNDQPEWQVYLRFTFK